MAKIYFDAATAGNPGQSACSIVIITEQERLHYDCDLGILDNHSAEWAAFVFALECAKHHGITTALVYTDSKLIEDSMNKGQVKNKQFINYLLKIKSLESYFDLLFVKWVPRNQNKEANHHAKNALYKITKTSEKKR
ncbi:ribonuclease HI family protein [Staphylococcus ureilyticus]|uniref:ribonuclease HI family protein n=1 Tax=Staphylococcus ureilyticus TaxID=94138 RepID=UPI000D1D0098|nr:ribonuclease HI family protein [Staphylococcus ureilyticus]MDU0461633.1 ribonuclease HI family protein [Staphylococcus ureilyticus]PTF26549.1 ribonuclease H [Staphylococcus cohnii]UXS61141.1 ribonuclease HI family protein [Staphylococcus ureilyticus]